MARYSGARKDRGRERRDDFCAVAPSIVREGAFLNRDAPVHRYYPRGPCQAAMRRRYLPDLFSCSSGKVSPPKLQTRPCAKVSAIVFFVDSRSNVPAPQ